LNITEVEFCENFINLCIKYVIREPDDKNPQSYQIDYHNVEQYDPKNTSTTSVMRCKAKYNPSAIKVSKLLYDKSKII
jgi:hypothetical protein